MAHTRWLLQNLLTARLVNLSHICDVQGLEWAMTLQSSQSSVMTPESSQEQVASGKLCRKSYEAQSNPDGVVARTACLQ